MSTEQLEHRDGRAPTPEGLGEWLRQSRERAGMSVEEVARALKLSGSTVQDLERDQTQHIGAPIYYKGFVRAYGKLLDLPAVALERRLSALVDTDPEPQIAQGTAPVRRNRWMERYTWVTSYAVGTALLLPLLYWLVSSDPATPPAPTIESARVQESNTSDGRPNFAANDAGAATAASETANDSPQSQASSETFAPPVTASLTPFGLGRGAPAGSSPLAADVRLELAAPSWVSIEDAKGERLVYRTLAAGSHPIEGDWPLRVRIGNAARAELFIAGQALTLDPYVRGNVADLALRSGSDGIHATTPSTE